MKKVQVFLIGVLLFISHFIFSQETIENKIDSSNKLKAREVWLEKELEIGGQKQEGGYIFGSIRSFRVDDEGNIFVIDTKARKLTKFDKQGKLVWKIGKTGQGPGEFQLLSGIELGKNNSVLVYDIGNRRIAYFSQDGKLLEEISTANQIRLFRVDDNSKGMFYGTIILRFEGRSEYFLNKFDRNFNIIKQLYKLELKRVRNEINFYSASIRYRIRNDDNIVYASTSEYIFYIADEEDTIRKVIVNKYKPIKITKADKKREFEERYGGRTLPPELKFIFPDYYPPIEHLLIDDQDNIFVRTYERTKDGTHYYDYFDAEGRYIASFPMKETIFCIRGDRFYTLEEDEEGYQKIVRYRYRLKLR